MEVDIHALGAFRNMSKILRTVCNSISTQIIHLIKVTKNSIDTVLNIMRGNTDIQIITQSEFIDKKEIDKVVVVKSKMKKQVNQRNSLLNSIKNMFICNM